MSTIGMHLSFRAWPEVADTSLSRTLLLMEEAAPESLVRLDWQQMCHTVPRVSRSPCTAWTWQVRLVLQGRRRIYCLLSVVFGLGLM